MKSCAPAAERNKGPILDVLRRVLPDRGVVLEIASGSGQHVVHFAAALPSVVFRPSDPSAEARESIDSWIREAALANRSGRSPGLPGRSLTEVPEYQTSEASWHGRNVEPARAIDVTTPGWDGDPVDAVLCINMIHISPWVATVALFQGAGRCLRPGAPLVLYGPYRFHGAFLAPSNAAFDESLRSRDASWGVRDIDDLDVLSAENGLHREEAIDMPANNHMLVYRRR